MLKKAEKDKIIEELTEKLSKCSIAIATDYRGIPAKNMVQLRKQLRSAGVDYKVAKNTLTRFAAEKSGKKSLDTLLTGPMAVAFGYDDVARTAKVLSDFIKTSGAGLKIKGGLLGDKLLSPAEISNLANLPSREVLIAQVIGQMFAPVQGLHNVLVAPLQNLVYVLQSRSKKLEAA
jgi:large subunit ribosomal protein L10